MKRFTAAVGLCVFLLLFGLFVFLPTTNAEKNLLENLLNLPAPPPPNPLVVNVRKNRSGEFFNKNNPPKDDAPIEELLAYWQSQHSAYRELGYNVKPSENSLARILSEIEKNPEKLTDFLNALPETSDTAEFVKRLYDQEISSSNYDRDWRSSVRRWLTYHSRYFSDDLLRIAERVGDVGEYVSNQDELLALARVDWDKARPILERLYNDNRQPVSQVLARWAFYRHALDENDSGDIDKYRDELKAVVENKSATAGMRDLAFDALVKEKEWKEFDDWYPMLLEDETLADLRVDGRSYTGLTTIMYYAPPEKYLEKMLELVKSNNTTVRAAAVRNLVLILANSKNPEVVQALLPWLENPKWAREANNERRLLVSALREFAIPESVPGLIAVLNEKQSQETRISSMTDSMTNSMSMNSSTMNVNRPMAVSRTIDYYPYRDEAVGALATQKDIRAAAPLRMILPQVENWQRGNVVRAILLSRGFSVAEQIEALESIAKTVVQKSAYASNMAMAMNSNSSMVGQMIDAMPPLSAETMARGNMMIGNHSYGVPSKRPFDASDIKPLLGIQLVNQPDAEEELVTALIDRIGVLDTKDPQLAAGLRKIMQNWNGAAVNRLLLKDLKNNRADTDSVVKLLSLRKDLREKQSGDVYDVRGGTPAALGIAACLIEDANGYDALLAGENTEAKTAMLACARLIRAKLPVRRVAENLESPNKTLASAAERYLAAEDSPEARQFVLALYPNEAKVLGARTYFAPGDSAAANSAYLPALFQSVNESLPAASYYIYHGYSEDLIHAEKQLQKEVRENQELLGVYAYAGNFVRIYKDKAVFSWQEDPARYRERELEREEFNNLKNYLAAERVDELPPFLSDCEGDCEGKELLMLGQQGGRRVFSLGGEQQPPKFFAEIESIFKEMRQPPAKLHYWLAKNVAGLEILFEDGNLQAEAVWKASDDFRVLINNQARRKQIDKEIEQQDEADEEKIRETEAIENYEKYEKFEEERQKRRERREFENYGWYKFTGGKLAGLSEQPGRIEFLPELDGSAIRADSRAWKARAEAFEIRSDGEGLYKISGGRTTKIREGYHDKPLVTANGRWLITTRYGEEGRQLIRINLPTNKEFKVDFQEYPLVETVAYLPLINRVLLFGGEYGEYEEETDLVERAGAYFFLDAETGAIQRAKGEVRPLAQQTFRPLQSNGTVGEFWAAIPDQAKDETQIGVYNQKTFAFKPLIKIPQITFDSMQMWVDASKIYFVYEGHLLALPLPKEIKQP